MTDPKAACIEEARRLRRVGLSPIPIVRRIGHCPASYAEDRRAVGMPAAKFESIVREYGAHGIQCFTGADFGNAIVDVDGVHGRAKWESWARKLGCPQTPTTITPRGGLQFWFRVPPDCDRVPTVHLWKGEGDHQGVEILGDGQQGRCWPCYKEIEGRRVHYAWESGKSPFEIPRATIPSWALDLALALRESGGCEGTPLKDGVRAISGEMTRTIKFSARNGHTWRDVRDGIFDKAGLASSWGLRLSGRSPNSKGWVSCHSIFREDRHPSAGFCPLTGAYWEPGFGIINFFALAIQLGAYADFNAAVDDLERIAGLGRAAS